MVIITPTNREEQARLLTEDARRRRIERLKQVRAAEASIASATRKAFRVEAEQRTMELLHTAKDAWEAAHEAELEVRNDHVAKVLGGIGVAHSAARTVRVEQAAEAAEGRALWKRGGYVLRTCRDGVGRDQTVVAPRPVLGCHVGRRVVALRPHHPRHRPGRR